MCTACGRCLEASTDRTAASGILAAHRQGALCRLRAVFAASLRALGDAAARSVGDSFGKEAAVVRRARVRIEAEAAAQDVLGLDQALFDRRRVRDYLEG